MFVTVYAEKNGVSSDQFGYEMDDQQPYNWYEANTGTEVILPSHDDAFVQVDIPFDFPFYENDYPSLFISTNGIISFGAGWTEFENQPIPRLHTPNNFIAPFWDDLAVGDVYNNGKIFTLYNASEQVFVVEWEGVSRTGDNENLLTFEAVLHQTGKICFQYAALSGILDQATVGIEDADGLDGLQYLHNSEGISNLVGNYALCFTRPTAPQGRVKLLPPYQSSLAQNGSAIYQVQVFNIGELGEDTINFKLTQSAGSWEAELYQEDGLTPLEDSDSDGSKDVRIAQGESITITVQMTTSGMQIGDYSLLQLKAESANTPGAIASAQIQSAIPASFMGMYSDGQIGLQFLAVTAKHQNRSTVVGDFTGSGMAMGEGMGSIYPLVWEFNNVNYANLTYQLRSGMDTPLNSTAFIRDNSLTSTLNVYDNEPAVAQINQAKTAVAWVRNKFNPGMLSQNSNIFYGLLNYPGSEAPLEFNVTNNAEFRDSAHPEIPVYKSPRIVVTEDEHRIITWEKYAAEIKNIEIAFFDSSDQKVADNSVTANSNPGIQYIKPSFVKLSDNRVLLVYSEYSNGQYHLFRAVYSASGNTIIAPEPIGSAQGIGADGVQFPSGTVLLAWTNTNSGRIEMVGLNGETFLPVGSPIELIVPYETKSDSVSIAQASSEMGVITWLDEEWNEQIYYCLVSIDDPSPGSIQIITHPMIMLRGEGLHPQVNFSENGQSISPYIANGVYLPLITKP
jgi:hypothetical protein